MTERRDLFEHGASNPAALETAVAAAGESIIVPAMRVAVRRCPASLPESVTDANGKSIRPWWMCK